MLELLVNITFRIDGNIIFFSGQKKAIAVFNFKCLSKIWKINLVLNNFFRSKRFSRHILNTIIN